MAGGARRHAPLRDRVKIVSRPDHPVEALYVVLSGRFAIHVDRGAGPKKVMEWTGGDVGGLLPYSRLKTPPGEAIIIDATEMLLVHRDCFPDMIHRCPTITAALVHVMLDRARALQFERSCRTRRCSRSAACRPASRTS